MAPNEISMTYCDKCSFVPKANYMAELIEHKLKGAAPSVKFSKQSTPDFGHMDVKFDGLDLYSKARTPNMEDPQPTPKELEKCLASLMKMCGKEGSSLTEEEKAKFAKLHAEQIQYFRKQSDMKKLQLASVSACVGLLACCDWFNRERHRRLD
eukprot:TRINITY_DN24565_c0_g1_i1.p1 TRINITY_DN24565_c0_g1~~TRINITY_DN24565_c0_g1_i1.p1  ORF type:complete len:179 (-),score=33.24 TRINITY_DN24565_c0_g1_i1:158-616(-)